MYWYKSRSKSVAALVFGAAVLLFWIGCKPDVQEQGASQKYFDIKGYFTKDIARLSRLNKPVIKTVYHNGVTETKTVHVDNWSRELGLFADADINKPAWKNSYKVSTDDSILVYRAREPELKVREVLIKRVNQQVKWILIYTKTENALYKTTQKLSYFPDSLYFIEMEQRVKFMQRNVYKIQGLMGGK